MLPEAEAAFLGHEGGHMAEALLLRGGHSAEALLLRGEHSAGSLLLGALSSTLVVAGAGVVVVVGTGIVVGTGRVPAAEGISREAARPGVDLTPLL